MFVNNHNPTLQHTIKLGKFFLKIQELRYKNLSKISRSISEPNLGTQQMRLIKSVFTNGIPHSWTLACVDMYVCMYVCRYDLKGERALEVR